MMQKPSRLALIATASLLPAAASAHPGHGIVDGLAHYLTPDHLLPVLVAVAVGVFLWRRRKRDR